MKIFAPLRLVLTVCFLLLTADHAHADVNTLRSSDNAIWGAYGGSFLNYKEESPPNTITDTERGWLQSGAVGASLLVPGAGHGIAPNLYLEGEGSGSFGRARYNGAYLASPNTPLSQNTNETIWTAGGKIGEALPLGNAVLLIPYAEIGYRFWHRKTDDEDYRNWDALGGLMLQASPMDRLILGVFGSAGSTFGANMRTGGETFNLGNAAVYKFGGKIGFDLTQQIELFVTGDYDQLHFIQSPVDANGFYEPTSRTSDTVFRLGLSYHYM